MKIGILSTFIEPDALKLVQEVQDAVKSGEIPNSEVSFIFSNRFFGENEITDLLLKTVMEQETPLITFSAARFMPEMRQEARRKARLGDDTMIKEWRNLYGEHLMPDLPQTDIDFLLGDMLIYGDNVCEARDVVNLHPALPTGPKGTWYDVTWDLIQNGESETGVMMHRITSDLDRGPGVAYCRFSIRGPRFDNLWDQLPKDEANRQVLISREKSLKEKSTYPLFRAIRDEGFIRETPLIIQTARAFAEGHIRIEGGQPIDKEGNAINGGYDLTSRIDGMVKPQLEGNLRGKEVK